MGLSYYVVLENGVHPELDGKALAANVEYLDTLSQATDHPLLRDFLGMSDTDFADLLGDNLEIPELIAQWFLPEAGLALLEMFHLYIAGPPELLEDLCHLQQALELAGQLGTRWHLNIDI